MHTNMMPPTAVTWRATGGALLAQQPPSEPSVGSMLTLGGAWAWCACAVAVLIIIFFPLRERRIELVAGIWWVRLLFLVFIALLAGEPGAPVSIMMLGACLAIMYVLASNAFAFRNVPILPDGASRDGDREAASAADGADPETQIAAVRHRQYSDLIQRCQDPTHRASDACRQLRELHDTVNQLHSRADQVPSRVSSK